MWLPFAILLACGQGVSDIDGDGIDGRDGGAADGGTIGDGGFEDGGDDGGGTWDGPIEDIDPSDLPQAENPCRPPELVHVASTHDGDTITVQSSKGQETIRFIGVDTPEVGYSGGEAECWGDEAAQFTHDWLDGATIWLSFDRDCTDPYDRTLAFLHTGLGAEHFVNRVLLRDGWATQLTISPNDTFEAVFEKDQREARAEGAGLWAACGGNP